MTYCKPFSYCKHSHWLLGSWVTECQVRWDAEVVLLKLECSKLPINSVQKGVYISLHFGPSLMFLSFCQRGASSEASICFKPGNKAIAYSKVTNLFVGHQLLLSSILLIPYYFCIAVEEIATCLVAINKTLFLFLLFSFCMGQESGCNVARSSAHSLTKLRQRMWLSGSIFSFKLSQSLAECPSFCWLTVGSGFWLVLDCRRPLLKSPKLKQTTSPAC